MHRKRGGRGRAIAGLCVLAPMLLALGACGSPRREPPAPVVYAPPAKPAPRAPAVSAAARASWEQFRVEAARRIVAANPGLTYDGAPPDILLGIPVLEVELNADGSVRRINVLREPQEATETVQIAIDAVRRAAPFGDVSRMPRPWKFAETFLFDDDLHFKPRSLDRD